MSNTLSFKPIPYGKHTISNEDIHAVVEVLNSDFLTQGPSVISFEKAFSEYIGCKYSVAVANGTAALHLCTQVLELSSSESVITTPITFAATGNCIRYQGAEVLFADIDPDTYLIDLNDIRRRLEKYQKKKKICGIIPVDFAGLPIDMQKLRMLADEFDLWIIEDSCHAPGGYFKDTTGTNQKCGNGVYADLAIFSFHPVKHIACGEGGMITTNNEELYRKLLTLRTHGITRSEEHFIRSRSEAYGSCSEEQPEEYPGWYMEMQDLGYNYRLSDIHAALGLSQLNRANENLNRRRKIAEQYHNAFKEAEYVISHSEYREGHAYHLYILEVDQRNELYHYLKTKNIYAQIHYIPLHLMPYYQRFGWKEGDFPKAERYYSRCITLPIYPGLSEEEQAYVVECVRQFYE